MSEHTSKLRGISARKRIKELETELAEIKEKYLAMLVIDFERCYPNHPIMLVPLKGSGPKPEEGNK